MAVFELSDLFAPHLQELIHNYIVMPSQPGVISHQQVVHRFGEFFEYLVE